MPRLRSNRHQVASGEVTIDQALRDRLLLGSALGNSNSWASWLAVLRASFGLPLSASQQTIFQQVAGGREPPSKRVKELWCVVGRRSGKSRMAAAVACYLATFVHHRLAVGETGFVLVIAASQSQAQTVFGYCLGFLQSSPVLSQEIASTTSSEIRLRNGIVIAIHSSSFRNVRGRTLVACVFDEAAFWRDDTASANPDTETYRAVKPSLMTTSGCLVSISTPYRKLGLLHQKHRDHYGVPGDEVLVVQGKSTDFNPLLSEDSINQALADDPEGSRAEWEATFRSDLSAFLDDTAIECAIDHSRPLELPPRHGVRYFAFADPSGGRHDAFTVCLGHQQGDGFVCDVIRGTRPPFDPVEVTKGYAALLKDDYRLTSVVGDNFSAEWVVAAFKDAGVKYLRSEHPKSQLYLECLPLFTRGLISIPDLPPLLKELRLLERQTHRSGKDTVDHGKRGSDDYANALCGCAAYATKRGTYRSDMSWVFGDTPTEATAATRMGDNEYQRRQRAAYVLSGGGTRPTWS
jgi:Terminase large subunit, T4likevirus-type, N-terminal